jgi:hypothetical protein
MITRMAAVDLCLDRGITPARCFFSHDTFKTVSFGWAKKVWLAWGCSLPEKLVRTTGNVRFPHHSKGRYNCEIRSIGLMHHALMSNILSLSPDEKDSVAFGCLWYSKANGVNHCTNFFVDHSNTLRFIDNQYGLEETIEDPELRSAYHMLLL